MSGHSKWSTIKRQKGATDAKRGQLFTKLAKEIIIAAKQGGSDPDINFRLRLAVQRGRDNNMPLENIERAIKRGSGESDDGAALIESMYEGYGPGGTAILIQALTDNKNRTVAEVRNAFVRNGSNMGEAGCVSWIFESKGVISVHSDNVDSEELALIAIDAGADDVKVEDNTVEIYTAPEDFESVQKALEENNVKVDSAEVTMVPKNLVALDEQKAISTLKFLEKLEDLDDVQHVYTNADFPDEALANYQS
ncbi:MAG: YebC/PmpR family DNA-binding transcriptional regulator [Chloroflexi bacterium]|jgi:YebC/PmpR family DNA-binding regulatory protein|nr:YebC/PmpR family DNA-binding transcriptional regulator [Chloroflexota bacterium]MBT7081367.1 YebC/PmpR family DNA-binding transcriptional regulator [Chloroflexota bacterium]MBT7290675.1 YebC/PmpR family DNA-binding transcriptional regulator [Chloroflexota bacterium]